MGLCVCVCVGGVLLEVVCLMICQIYFFPFVQDVNFVWLMVVDG